MNVGCRRKGARHGDSPFAGLRASAGAHLLEAGLMRARIVPLLQDIETDVWGSAGWTAFWAPAPDDHGGWLGGLIDIPDSPRLESPSL